MYKCPQIIFSIRLHREPFDNQSKGCTSVKQVLVLQNLVNVHIKQSLEGEQCYLSDFDNVLTVGARWVSLGISGTGDLLRFSHTKVPSIRVVQKNIP